tara:strand:+ start:1486 stop:1881 length:396 start_codon:yes stop_codon:yes gene_type:complete
MKPKTTLTITALIGLIFSSVMFIAPEFVTREQFPNAEGQGFTDLVTVRYAIASLILALVIITYHLRNVQGRAFQAQVMRGYTLAFSVVCITTLILQVLGKISAVPPTVGTGLITVLSFVSWRNLAKEPGQN